MSQAPPSSVHVASRVAAGLLGSYAFVWGFVVLVAAAGAALGMDFHDAEGLADLFAFLVFLVCFCWAFVERRLGLVWAVLAGGGALMTGAAWLVAGTLA